MAYRKIVPALLALSATSCAGLQSTSMLHAASRQYLEVESKSEASTCVPMRNLGTHSVIKLSVGTPMNNSVPQSFSVIPDTGSNAVIIPSCVCVSKGYCAASDGCFTGTNRSSTFAISGKPQAVYMRFGSGTIMSVAASDVVSVGTISTFMRNATMLMVAKQLNVVTHFGGILGLGIPQTAKSKAYYGFRPRDFLSMAGISTFSICLRNNEGSLRIGESMPSTAQKIGSVGTLHWGAGLAGVSPVGKKGRSLGSKWLMCDSSTMKSGQKTPCGAIVDSGTTAITAPAMQLTRLFASICDSWARCRKQRLAKIGTGYRRMYFKAVAFMRLLRGCAKFDLKELPDLHFNLTGASKGESMVLKLSGLDYIMQMTTLSYNVALQHLETVVPKAALLGLRAERWGPKYKLVKVCTPAFAAMNMKTKYNGDVWILGTPVFYKYSVHYDLLAKPRPAMAFAEGGCTACSTNGTSLMLEGVDDTSGAGQSTPRTVDLPWRLPKFELGDTI